MQDFFPNVAFNQEESIKEELHKFWSLESLGTIDKETVEERFLQDVSWKDGRYVVKLPWKDQHPLLYDNFVLAKKRLESLIGFRLHNIAVAAGIEKAFLNNGIQEDDRDALRFLWKEDPFDRTSKYKVLWFTRICFGLVSSMFHHEATIDHHLNHCLCFEKCLFHEKKL